MTHNFSNYAVTQLDEKKSRRTFIWNMIMQFPSLGCEAIDCVLELRPNIQLEIDCVVDLRVNLFKSITYEYILVPICHITMKML